ncbi:hypothetical protein GQ43DRAFT_260427 [Delitschia confertaspora ATCC 74209]|uniref:Uncharacterized protein n=1 Tax=Delitschia confertaspora ATCC 74209 TaxID=1513339 RepID=A0A9P4JUM3_9PLEO|nr:hypothetical protein GQ43DRAFT_260427 [Delitschia confertaspora ATCC 74209]
MKLGLFLSLLLVLVYTDSASSLTSIRDVTETDQSPEDRKATKTYATTIADTFEGDGVAFTGLNYKKDECGCDSLSISSSSSSSNSSNSNFNAAFNLPAIIGTATGIENNETGGSLIKVYMTRFIVSGQEGESTGRALVQTKPPFSEPGPHGTLSQMIPPTPFSQSDFFSHVTFPLPKLSSEAPNPGHGTTPVGGPREIQPPPDSSSAFPKPEETQPLPAAPSVPLDSVPAPSSTRVGSPPAIESCFKSPACTSVFSHVSTCFHNLTGGYPDPLDDAKSWEYRHCFCDEYLHLVKNVESDMETCFYCLIDAGSRVIDVRTLQQDFQNFCATKWPNLRPDHRFIQLLGRRSGILQA